MMVVFRVGETTMVVSSGCSHATIRGLKVVLYAFVYLPKAFKQLPFKQLPEYHNCGMFLFKLSFPTHQVHGFSNDASYVISGSDDSMIPIFGLWMAKASEQLGVVSFILLYHEYMEAVKNRYKHLHEVKRKFRYIF
uniref:Uncharacterized protein n=1 Tax=Helianthus annuus TaxID=4232 RepID=A0A251RXS3_HELAN